VSIAGSYSLQFEKELTPISCGLPVLQRPVARQFSRAAAAAAAVAKTVIQLRRTECAI